MKHIGDGPNSQHNNAIRFCDALLNQAGHIDHVMQRLTDEEVRLNRLRVKATIDLVCLCSFQGISTRGRDERVGSKTWGNFLEILSIVGSYNEEIASIVLENAPGNVKYTSPDVQKEVLHLCAEKVQKKIVEDIGNSKF
ncbi:zinc finger MYM-type protein 1-like protein [Tanacetum coccineum]